MNNKFGGEVLRGPADLSGGSGQERKPFERKPETEAELKRLERTMRALTDYAHFQRELKAGQIPINDITLAEAITNFRMELTPNEATRLTKLFYDRGAYITDNVGSKVMHLANLSSAQQLTILKALATEVELNPGSHCTQSLVVHSKNYKECMQSLEALTIWYREKFGEDLIISAGAINQVLSKFRKQFASFEQIQLRLSELCDDFGCQPNVKVASSIVRWVAPEDKQKTLHWLENEYGITEEQITQEQERRKRDKKVSTTDVPKRIVAGSRGLPDDIANYRQLKTLTDAYKENVPPQFHMLIASHAPTLQAAESALQEIQQRGTSIHLQAINQLLGRRDQNPATILDKAIQYETQFRVAFAASTAKFVVERVSDPDTTKAVLTFFKERNIDVPVESYEKYAFRLLRAGLSPKEFSGQFEWALTDLIAKGEMKEATDRVGFAILFARYLMLTGKPQDLERGVAMIRELISGGKKIDTQYQYLIGLLVVAYLPEGHELRSLIMGTLRVSERSLVFKNRAVLGEEFRRWADARETSSRVGWGVSRIYEDASRRPVNRQAGMIFTKDTEST